MREISAAASTILDSLLCAEFTLGFLPGTVEFRCFNSTLHAGRAAAYINLCLAMSAQAIAQRSTVMRKTHSDNELSPSECGW